MGEFVQAQNNGQIKSRKTLTKRAPKLTNDLLKKLSEKVVSDEPTQKPKTPENCEKLFGIISKDLINELQESNSQQKRISVIEEISVIITRKLNVAHI